MEIKRNGANGRRAQSVSHNGILYTSGITTTDLDADITGQTQDVIHIIDNILARNGIDKTRVLTAAITLADMADYGAFVEIAPGKEGLVHISKLDTKRVEKVEDVVAVGDELLVKVTEIDQQGRINLSRKDALADLAAKQK